MKLPRFMQGVWRFMHFTTLYRADDPSEVYMHRFQFIETPWFSVRLHWIKSADVDPDPHDHPFDFVSFVLWGWYLEEKHDEHETYAAVTHRKVCWFNRCKAAALHRIVRISERTVVTLVFTGGRKRAWGYRTPITWLAWREYKEMQEAGLV